MKDFLIRIFDSDNFMRFCYLLAVLGLLFAGYTNKQELISLYKYTISVCG